jgi:hypothetical protein
MFGPLVFYAVLPDDGTVELASITGDPDYRRGIDEDPE